MLVKEHGCGRRSPTILQPCLSYDTPLVTLLISHYNPHYLVLSLGYNRDVVESGTLVFYVVPVMTDISVVAHYGLLYRSLCLLYDL